ncbi:polysaccharide biosynthesis/export family protein [Rhodomicrobium vannielii ATCC 17100]|uniref:polysaccharide biosynthesis/export family protein n=1 Tax=Rhodomicrobium vannielii TaxID=1069 RepID=UPI00191ADD97|nr:polysaccharide biosynthesis/export family protein [Rhodomicrobium vannielii]MBJ7535367.1 polysaccharide biosynthesis/export family protein [Rhodomicrobium vannielii ATCC 17100]
MYRKGALLVAALFVLFCQGRAVFAADAPKSLSETSIQTSKASSRDELGIGDKLKVAFFGNIDLSGEVNIQSDGTITLPVLGTFQSAGKTVGELTRSISERFSQDPTKAADNVVVSVIEWRPVFVTGDVTTSGSYPYTPGMTVLHAISVAGGFFRLGNSDPATFVNVAQNTSRMREIQEQTKYQIVRRASLLAEKAGETSIKPPLDSGMVDERTARKLVEDETRSLSLRRKALRDEIEMRQRQVTLTRQEINDHTTQLKRFDEELKSKKAHLAELNALLSKGVSKRPDLLSVDSYIATLESNRRELFASISRAQRDLAQLEQVLTDIPLRRQIQIEEELTTLDERIQSNKALYEAARQIVEQFRGPENEYRTISAEAPKRSLQIMRKTEGGQIFIAADYETSVRPGDVVVVGGQVKQAAELLASWRPTDAPVR